MKYFELAEPARRLAVRVGPVSALRRMAICALAAALAGLTGCVTTRTVDKTVLAPNVRDATLSDLLKKMAVEYEGVQSLQLSVNFTATEGGARQGQVKELPSFKGIILLRKPGDLHVIMQLPVVGSRALDMVSDGKNFKLLISAGKNQAVVGSETMTTPSANGLYNLRPSIIRDALQLPPVGADEFVTLTENSRLLAPARGKKDAVEEPDYDISVLRHKPDEGAVPRTVAEGDGHVLERLRVIHVSRVTLLPYEQDLYDAHGRLAQTIAYSKFQKFSNVDYPTSILITRPLDEYTLKIDIGKVLLNPKLEDEQFLLEIPEGVPVRTM